MHCIQYHVSNLVILNYREGSDEDIFVHQVS